MRNFLRHKVIPQFDSREGIDIYGAIMRATENLQKDSEALDIWAAGVKDTAVDTLTALPDAVLFRVLANALEAEQNVTLSSVMF